jgi:DNA-binding response OmpR family regulator
MFNIMSIQMLCAKVKSIPKGADKALDGYKGIAALKKKLITCCKEPYKLVIVDLNMPNLDGISMMHEIARI